MLKALGITILLLGLLLADGACASRQVVTSTSKTVSPETTTTLSTNTTSTGGISPSAYYDAAKTTLERVYFDSQATFTATTPEAMGPAVLKFMTSVEEALAKWQTFNPPGLFEASHDLGLAALQAYNEGLELLYDATLKKDAAGLEESQALLVQADDYYSQWQAQLADEMSMTVNLPSGVAGEITAMAVQVYLTDVGELGETMNEAERTAAALSTGKEMPPPTPENMEKASEIAEIAAAAWEGWKSRTAPIEELATLHTEMLKYLETMSAALSHLEVAVRSSDLSEYLLFGELIEEAYVHKKAAWAEVTRLSTSD